MVVPPVSSTAEFYRELAYAAGFPDWFGANLDALWDTLTDLSGPTALILARWTRLARAEPHDWPRILATLEQRTAIGPPFAVVRLGPRTPSARPRRPGRSARPGPRR